MLRCSSDGGCKSGSWFLLTSGQNVLNRTDAPQPTFQGKIKSTWLTHSYTETGTVYSFRACSLHTLGGVGVTLPGKPGPHPRGLAPREAGGAPLATARAAPPTRVSAASGRPGGAGRAGGRSPRAENYLETGESQGSRPLRDLRGPGRRRYAPRSRRDPQAQRRCSGHSTSSGRAAACAAPAP